MDEFNGCICQLLGTLIGGVWNAMAESDAFSVTTDLGGLSSQGGMQAATVTQPRLPAAVGAGAPGDAAAADATALAEPASVGPGGVTPAQIAALIILVAVVIMTFLQGSTSSTPAASKRRRGGGGGGGGDSGRDGETGHHREGPSVA